VGCSIITGWRTVEADDATALHSSPTPCIFSIQLHTLAYNLGNFLPALKTPDPIKDWSVTTLEEKLVKIGAKVVNPGR
jgi:hypothetical protein